MKRLFVFVSLFILKTIYAQNLNVLSTNPIKNSNVASISQIITIQFDQPIDTTYISDYFNVFSSYSGLSQFTLFVDPTLSIVRLEPIRNFSVGELVGVTIRPELLGSTGSTFNGYSFQFRVLPTLITPPCFEEPRIFSQFAGFGIHVVQINDDELPDLILYSQFFTDVLQNIGNGNFSLFQHIPYGGFSCATDMDLDENIDLIIGWSVFEQGSNGFFYYDSSLNVGNWDMNCDGYPDYVYYDLFTWPDSLTFIAIRYNNQGGQIGNPDTILVDTYISGLTVADFNNDGIQDISYFTNIFATPTGTGGENSVGIIYLDSQGDTLYRKVYNGEDFPFGGSIGMPFRIITGDFNNDEYNDILLQTNVDDLLIFNDRQGGFNSQNAQITGGGDLYHMAFSGDVNGDGWLDLVYNYTIGANEHASTVYLLNNSGILSTEQLIYEEEMARIDYSALADFDNNGAVDVISTWWNRGLYLHLNRLTNSVLLNESMSVDEFCLLGNFPNPFNSETTIAFYSPKLKKFEFIIYDITGKEVKRFPEENYFSGVNILRWDGRNNHGKEVSSGIYFFKKVEKSPGKSIRLIYLK